MLFIANWKMNPLSIKEAERLFQKTKEQIKQIKKEDLQVIVCPPTIFLSRLSAKTTNQIKLGVQNVCFEDKGAFTGEISSLMAKNLNVEYSLVGHSERRLYFHEDNLMCKRKIKACFANNLIPIYCIGETKEEKEKGLTQKVLEQQLTIGLGDINLFDFKKVIIAYEPVWAISTQKNAEPASPDDVLSSVILVKKILWKLFERFNKDKGFLASKILYGGSVSRNTIAFYANNQNLAGFLVGSASLDPINFGATIKEVMANRKNNNIV